MRFERLAGTQNSHYRCGVLVIITIQTFGWHSKFTFPLPFPGDYCNSNVWLALEIRSFLMFLTIRTFGWNSKFALSLWLPIDKCERLAGAQKSQSRCGLLAIIAIRTFGWQSKFACSLRNASDSCDSNVWLALKFRIPAALP